MMDGKKELKGVGGWLAFLVISMGILSPLRTLGGYYRDVILTERANSLSGIPVWETYKWVVLALVVVSAVLFLLAAYRLWKQPVWRSVRFAIMAMWLACTGMDVIGMMVLYFVFGADFAKMVWYDGMGQVFQGMIYPAIWTIYLLKSKRVRNTYRKVTDMEELAQTFGMKGIQR